VATLFSVMLLERRTSQFISSDDWENYLLRAFRQNRPANELLCEILSSDGTDDATRAAAQFYIARQGDPHLITRDVGRIIFGRDMQCAQCHDHPLVEDYLQRDYHALFAVFNSGQLITKKVNDKDTAFYGEEAGKDDVYESVFVEGKHVTGPRLPGQVTFAEPILLPGADRQARAEHADVPKPAVSRRELLAKAATDGTNRAFNENLANRLWAHMMGRALVHPVDFCHSANPPTHPELLRILGERLAAMKFNVRAFLRELALTQAYQRSIDPPSPSEDVAVNARMLQEELARLSETSEAVYDASAAQYQAAKEAFEEAETRLVPAVEDFAAKRIAMGALVQKYDETKRAADEISSKLAAQAEALSALEEARDKAAIAVQKLSGDEALAAAAKTFGERAATLAGEVESLRSGAAEKQAALEPMTAEKTAATEVAEAAVATLVPLKEQIRELEAAMVKARETMIDDFTVFSRLGQRSEHVVEILAWRDSHAELAEAESLVAVQRAELEQKQGECAACVQSVQTRSSELRQIHSELEAASAPREQLEEKVTAIGRQTEKLAAALSAVREVNGGMDAGESLEAAAAHIESTIAQLRTDREAHQQQLEAAQAAIDALRARLAAAQSLVDTAASEQGALEAAAEEARSAVEDAEANVSELTSTTSDAWRALTEAWSAQGTIRPLVHLSPEQMCWGMLQATGVYEQTWRQEAAALDAEEPLEEHARQSPFKWLERRREIEARTYEKLKGNLGPFVQLYGVGAGQPQAEFFASAEQALFLSNGSTVSGWTAPADDNVTARMLKADEPAKMAGELYLSILGRKPSEEEAAMVAQYVSDRPGDKREAAVRDLVWGLLTAAEFRFNH
jgi:hypothetical protein